jgi:hypothetical protein
MKLFTPELAKLPKRTVLTRTVVGNPNKATEAIPTLYGTAYGTKFKVFKPRGKKMEISWLSAFWPDAHKKPKSKWTGIWNLEVSPFVRQQDLLQKDPKRTVKLDRLKSGLFAQILHVGPYSKEGPTVKMLHAFIREKGLKISGPHEEVYLSRPGPKAKTIIRYAVKK